jgi:hypothetical protein
MRDGIDVIVPVTTDYETAAAALRSDVLCWLPPAIAGRGASAWSTQVRGGVVDVRVEVTYGAPWSEGGTTVSRSMHLEPKPGAASGAAQAIGTRLARSASGHLVLRDDPQTGPTLRFTGRLEGHGPLALQTTSAAVRTLVEDIAGRLPTAPTTPPDTEGGAAVSTLRCAVERA